MVIRAIKRLFGGSEGPAGLSPEQAEIRMKGLKAQLTKNKSEAKRLTSEVNLAKNVTAARKAEVKARVKELETDRKEIVRQMKALQKRLPKK
jgi:Tfp pilus assembly protein PilN